MRLITNSTFELYPNIKTEPMYVFNSTAVAIEKHKIKNIEASFWRYNNESECIPIALITLEDGTKMSLDFRTEEERDKGIKTYLKNCKIKAAGKED